MSKSTSGLHDPYEDQLAAARYRAERDQARQELDRMRPSYEWVSKNGGVESIESDLCKYMQIARSVTLALFKDSFPTRIADNDEIAEELGRRLMPPGMEWPRFEDGEPFVPGYDGSVEFFGDGIIDVWIDGECHQMERGERVKRVKRPAVLAADGEPLEVGQTVWHTKTGAEYRVLSLPDGEKGAWLEDSSGKYFLDHAVLTHQRPVLDADGVPCKKGDTVYALCDGSKHVVECANENGTLKSAKPNSACYLVASRCTHTKPVIGADGLTIKVGDTVFGTESTHELIVDGFVEDGSHGPYTVDCHLVNGGEQGYYRPNKLTHTEPEPTESWERIEEDARGLDRGIDRGLLTHTHVDIVRRCKALAEKGETE